MFHVIGVVAAVWVVLALIGWLLKPRPDQVVVVVRDEWDPRPAMEAMAANLGRELQQTDREVRRHLAVDRQRTIDEYRTRLRG